MPTRMQSGIQQLSVGDAPQTTAFLARANAIATLDGTHTLAYKALINGLVSDGLFSLFDALWIFATSDSGVALLNLISTSFNAVAHGPPTFTTDRGYTGTDDNTGAAPFLDTGLNPATSAAEYTLNNAHISTWLVTNVPVVNGGNNMGCSNGSFSIALWDTFSDGNVYMDINQATDTSVGAPATRAGHWIGNRTGSSALAVYQNATLVGTPNDSSGSIPSLNIYICASNNSSSPRRGSPNQLAMASVGAALTGAQTTSFYNRLRAYMTAVGVP